MVVEVSIYWWVISSTMLLLIGVVVGVTCEKADERALDRYRTACALVWRWNGQVPNSAETSEWIMEVGEGKRPMDIERFRESLGGK